LAEWDLGAARIELVSISENSVFRVDTDTGEAYALRIHRPGYHSLTELYAEQQWTAALNRAGIGAPVPKMTRAGGGYATVPLPGSTETRHVGLVRWIDGVSLASILKRESGEQGLKPHFDQLGRFAARIHNQAASWPIPPGFQRHAFDAEGLMGDAPFWGPFWELPELKPSEREHILNARSAIYRTLSDYGKGPESYSLIHADLHPYNVLVDGEKVSIIDFDDAGFGWHLYELAVALFYDQGKPHFETVREALISGYRSERPLDDRDVELLPMFLLIRALVMLGWLHERPEHQEDGRLRKLIRQACDQAEKLRA
jgi:Ser/Thr protein kinase RdoA (MazF antagonist)